MRWLLLAVLACAGCAKAESTSSREAAAAPSGPTSAPLKSPKADGDEARSHTVGHLTVTAVPVFVNSYAVWVTTKEDAKNAQFTAWTDDRESIAPLQDDLGNSYPARADRGKFIAASFGPRAQVELHKEFRKTLPREYVDGSGQVTSQIARCDYIVFQDFAPKAKRMTFTLPAKNVGGTGVLRFTFDRAKVAEQLATSD